MHQLTAGTARNARTRFAHQQWRGVAGAALALLGAVAAPSARAAASGEPTLPDVVVGAAPLPGTAVAVDALPGEVHSLDAATLAGAPARDPTAALAGRFAGIALEDTLGDSLQSSLAYRGFAASPVLGTPQGLAVYQGGVRLNEAFGDVVNWDLVPAFAVRHVDVTSASPLYGPNALGGAVIFTMKNGSTDPGLAAELEAGSFAERAAAVGYGARAGDLAFYVAARTLDDDGARRFSANSLRQLYADARYTTARDTIALSVSGADNSLDGPGAAPLQELALSRSLTFTGPQQTDNRLGLAALSGESRLGDSLAVAGVAYYRRFRQALENGNTTAYRPCTAAPTLGLLCQPDGTTPLATTAGAAVADPTGGGALPLGENDSESVQATSRGAGVQLSGRTTLLGLEHALAAGAGLDAARVEFGAATQLGLLDPQLQVEPGGPVIATAEGTAFQATPIDLGVVTRVVAWHASDAVSLTPALVVTGGAEYTRNDIELSDRLGAALSGTSRYQRLNPALGATYRWEGGPTAYAGYAETTRAPSPSEIECSDPSRPCLLPSTLAGDPPRLREVVARTWEAGLRQARGAFGIDGAGVSAALFRADLSDDIYGIATSAGTGYYANIGATRRQGASFDLSYTDGRWSGFVSGAFIDATFRSALEIPSPQNPFADADGDIQVRSGARLPGIARVRATAGLEWRATAALAVGAAVTGVGPSYFHGDESNQNPPLPGYARLDLHARLACGPRVELTLAIDNLLDAHYATYGLYADPSGIGAPGVPAAGNGALDHRFESPAAPLALRLGLRARL
jgi:iron complex outermembrane receptor protein